MAWVDAQDLAREREEAARKEQTKQHAEKLAERHDRDERLRGMFRDPLEVQLKEAVRVDLETQHGYLNPHEEAAAQEQAQEAMRPYWDEWQKATGTAMPVEVQSEILAGLRRGKLPDERVGMLKELLLSKRTKVYETRAGEEGVLGQANAFIAEKLPLLDKLCKTTGVGDSVKLGSFFTSQVKERSLAAERGATAARPFASLLKRR